MIEAVVALALVVIMLAGIGSLFATNARGVQTLEQRVALVEAARSIANNVMAADELPPSGLGGDVAGHRWQMRASPFFGDEVIPSSAFIPQRVEIRVRSPSGVVLSLESVRLQRRPDLR